MLVDAKHIQPDDTIVSELLNSIKHILKVTLPTVRNEHLSNIRRILAFTAEIDETTLLVLCFWLHEITYNMLRLVLAQSMFLGKILDVPN